VWWFLPVSSAALVGEHIAVTCRPLYRRPRSAIRVQFGVAIGPPNVDGCPNPASSISTSKMFGAPAGGSTSPMMSQSGVESPIVCLPTPRTAGRASAVSCGQVHLASWSAP